MFNAKFRNHFHQNENTCKLYFTNTLHIHRCAANSQNTTEMFPEDTFSGVLFNGANGDNFRVKNKFTVEIIVIYRFYRSKSLGLNHSRTNYLNNSLIAGKTSTYSVYFGYF